MGKILPVLVICVGISGKMAARFAFKLITLFQGKLAVLIFRSKFFNIFFRNNFSNWRKIRGSSAAYLCETTLNLDKRMQQRVLHPFFA
jgi:hypothetical protein